MCKEQLKVSENNKKKLIKTIKSLQTNNIKNN